MARFLRQRCAPRRSFEQPSSVLSGGPRGRRSGLRWLGPRCELLEQRTLLAADFGYALAGTANNELGQGVALGTAGNVYEITNDTVFKLTAAGTQVWATPYTTAFTEGGTKPSIAVDGTGNVYITGDFLSSAGFGSSNFTALGNEDSFIAKLDSNGNFLWAHRFGGSGAGVGSNAIAVDASGNVYTTGLLNGTANFDPQGTYDLVNPGSSQDAFISKLDTNGNFVWAEQIGQGNGVQGNAISVDAVGNVYSTGFFGGTTNFDPQGTFNLPAFWTQDYVLKLDTNGGFVWAKGFDTSTGSAFGQAIAVDSAGNVDSAGMFSGTEDFDPGAGVYDLSSAAFTTDDDFVLQLDGNGNFVWAHRFDNPTNSMGLTGMALDAVGNVYTTGTFTATTDFNPDGAGYKLASFDHSGGTDLFIAQLSSGGGFAWAEHVGKSGESVASNSLAVTPSGNVYDTGTFRDTINFNPQGTFNLSSNIGTDWFVLNLTQISISGTVWNDENGNGVRDSGEPGVANAVAVLFQSTDNVVGNADDAQVATAITDSQGRYVFTGLTSAANYYVEIRTPVGFAFTTEHVGGDPTLDSDVAAASGYTAMITLATGQSAVEDAGLTGAAPGFGWALGIFNGNDEGNAVRTDSHGNVYFAGRFLSGPGGVDFDYGPGTYSLVSTGFDGFVAKYTPTGALVWARRVGGNGTDSITGLAIDAAGNVLTAGTFSGTVNFATGVTAVNLTAGASTSAFVWKLDPNGNLVWADQVMSGSTSDPVAVAVDSQNDVFTTGDFTGTAGFDPHSSSVSMTSAGGKDGFVSKLNPQGNYVWAESFGGANNDNGAAITIDAGGDALVTGAFINSANFKTAGGPFALVGPASFLSTAFVAKFDPTGNAIWAKSFNSVVDSAGEGIAADTAGDVYSTGSMSLTTDFDPGPGTYNLSGKVYISKLDANGNFVWADALDSTFSIDSPGIALDSQGNVYTTGPFDGTTDFDPGPAVFNVASQNSSANIYVLQLTNAGKFVVVQTAGEPGTAKATAIAVDSGANIYTTGQYQSPDNFDPTGGTDTVNGTGGANQYLWKINAPNQAPSFVNGGNETVNEDAGASIFANWATNISPGPPNESGQTVTFLVSNDDNSLFTVQPSIDASGNLIFTPAPNVNGTADVTVRAHDNGGTANGGVDTSLAQTFTITVNFVNDQPSFTAVDPPPVNEDASAQTVANWAAFNPGTGANEAGQTVMAYTVSQVSNTSLFSSLPAIDSNGDLSYTPAANMSGTSTFVVQVQDSGGTANGGIDTSLAQTFTITVNFVNDQPSFTAVNPPPVNAGSGAQVVANWAVFNPGPGANEAGQTAVAYTVSQVSSPGLFAVAPAVATNGTLTYTLANDQSGTSTFTVQVQDSGGTANGGVDTSLPKVFTISFLNTAPTAVADTFVLGQSGASTGSGETSVLGNDQSNDGQPQNVQAVLELPATHGTLTLNADGSFSYLPGAGFQGLDRFTYRATEDGLASAPVTVTLLSYPASIVTKLYNQVLGRAPDDGGLQFWTSQIMAGASYSVVAEGIFESDERLDAIIAGGQLGNISYPGYYPQFLLRAAEPGGLAYWKSIWQRDGGPDNVIAGMLGSPEFYASAGQDHPDLSPNAAWATALYERLLNREPDASGLQFWASNLDNGAMTRQQVVLGFVRSDENFLNLTTGFFEEYLSRLPSADELNLYVNQFRAGATQRDIQLAIINLPEYANTPPPPADGTVERIG